MNGSSVMPMTTPSRICTPLARMTMRRIRRSSAPSARRTPISRVRWPTWKASTPKRPAAASTSATPANTANIVPTMRKPAVLIMRDSSNVRTQ